MNEGGKFKKKSDLSESIKYVTESLRPVYIIAYNAYDNKVETQDVTDIPIRCVLCQRVANDRKHDV